MHYLIRLRVFLLCCLLVIGMNVLLIMGGYVAAGQAAGFPRRGTGSLAGCDTRYTPDSKRPAVPPGGSPYLASRCGYGFCVEKR
jgi:hypothetical protein